MKEEETLIEKKFKGEDKVIIVKPIMRTRNPLISDPDHEAYFLFGNATNTYTLPRDSVSKALINPFTKEGEKEWLEKELDLDLNIYKRSDNFFHDHIISLGKEPLKLNLKNPKDYLDYIILKANKRYIAPDGESQKKKATYKYALVSEEFETKKTASKADMLTEAYMALGKLRESKDEMLDFLKVYGKKVSPVSKTNHLVSTLKGIIEEDLEGFLKLVHDKENYKLRLLIANAVEAGIINKQGRKYFLPGGDPLCGPGDVPVISTVIDYLKSPAQQDILSMLKARLDNAKE